MRNHIQQRHHMLVEASVGQQVSSDQQLTPSYIHKPSQDQKNYPVNPIQNDCATELY